MSTSTVLVSPASTRVRPTRGGLGRGEPRQGGVGRAAVLVGLLATLGVGACSNDRASTTELTVAAASDLRPAFEAIGEAFTATTGTRVTFSFGSSGQLRTQILNGAPFDVFASADVAFVDEVVAAGRGRAETVTEYAIGRIALWSPGETAMPLSVADLDDPRFARIAIANPLHAPYGRAAEQALDRAGVLASIRSRLVFGETVADTFEIARSGNADVAIIALSLAIAEGSGYVTVPASLHEPLRQALVVVGGRDPDVEGAAAAFTAFVVGQGSATMARYGFEAPASSTAGP